MPQISAVVILQKLFKYIKAVGTVVLDANRCTVYFESNSHTSSPAAVNTQCGTCVTFSKKTCFSQQFEKITSAFLKIELYVWDRFNMKEQTGAGLSATDRIEKSESIERN